MSALTAGMLDYLRGCPREVTDLSRLGVPARGAALRDAAMLEQLHRMRLVRCRPVATQPVGCPNMAIVTLTKAGRNAAARGA